MTGMGRDMDLTNPYDILGVPRDADRDEIKEAYREQARRHHPDANPEDDSAGEHMKRINNAYEILSNPEKRAFFDEAFDRRNKSSSSDDTASSTRKQTSPEGFSVHSVTIEEDRFCPDCGFAKTDPERPCPRCESAKNAMGIDSVSRQEDEIPVSSIMGYEESVMTYLIKLLISLLEIPNMLYMREMINPDSLRYLDISPDRIPFPCPLCMENRIASAVPVYVDIIMFVPLWKRRVVVGCHDCIRSELLWAAGISIFTLGWNTVFSNLLKISLRHPPNKLLLNYLARSGANLRDLLNEQDAI